MTQPQYPTDTARARALLGLAIGDALGAATEFQPQARAQRHPELNAGYQPGSPFGFQPGEATDDTQMTLAAYGPTRRYLEHGEPARYVTELHAGFAEWLDATPPDVGSQTRAAITRGPRGGMHAYYAAAASDPQGMRLPSGNGGLMRAAGPYAAGALAHPNTHTSNENAFAAALQSAVTHYSPECLVAAYVYADALAHLGNGTPLQDAFTAALHAVARPAFTADLTGLLALAGIGPGTHADSLIFQQHTRQAVATTSRIVRRGLTGELTKPSGYVLHTLQNAVAHNAAHHAYGDVILAATRHGGDSDTIAAVAGALAGAADTDAMNGPDMASLLYDLRIGHTWARWGSTTVPAAPILARLASHPHPAAAYAYAAESR